MKADEKGNIPALASEGTRLQRAKLLKYDGRYNRQTLISKLMLLYCIDMMISLKLTLRKSQTFQIMSM